MSPTSFPASSLKSKILLPFTLIVVVMTFASVGLSMFAVVLFFKRPDYFVAIANHTVSFNWTLARIMVVIISGLFIINGFILWIYALIIGNITKKLGQLTQTARLVAAGEYDQWVTINGQDEVGQLSDAFNHMLLAIKESSDRLIREKEYSEAIVSSIPEGIIVTDMSHHLLLANPYAEKIFNFSSLQAQGKLLLEYLHNEDLNRHFKEERTQEHIQREIILPAPDGKDRSFMLSSSFLYHQQHQETCGIITIIRDITQERELEELREGFLRTVTHELRTPLTSIIGFLELIQSSENLTETKRTEWMGISLKEANQLKNLIDDLLDLSQIRAGRVKMSYSTINVRDLFEQLAQLFIPIAKSKHIELIIGEVSPTLFVKADSSKLRRIMVNLISNALKFTSAGYVRLDCEDGDPDVNFSITDTGIGLKDHEIKVIFEKFRQIDYSSTRKYDGIGLGLSIVKQLVEMHGGRVWVNSVFGKGSTFYCSIPKK